METSGPLDGPWLSAFWVRSPLPIRSKSNDRQDYKESSQRQWTEHEDLSVALRAAVAAACPAE